MKNTYKHTALFLILIGFLNSCTDTVDVDVPNGGARLVVEASIDWEKGTSGQTQTIKLSESTAFFDNNPDVPATGAFVTVTKDDDGMQFTFQDQTMATILLPILYPKSTSLIHWKYYITDKRILQQKP